MVPSLCRYEKLMEVQTCIPENCQTAQINPFQASGYEKAKEAYQKSFVPKEYISHDPIRNIWVDHNMKLKVLYSN